MLTDEEVEILADLNQEISCDEKGCSNSATWRVQCKKFCVHRDSGIICNIHKEKFARIAATFPLQCFYCAAPVTDVVFTPWG